MKTGVMTILVFFIVVLVHEFGHFIVAKLSGVKVHEFAIGMGPKIFRTNKGETDYTLRLLPIGGYVRMEGEDEDSTDERSFGRKSIGARIAIVVAGAFMNFVLAIIVFTIHSYSLGTPTTTIGKTIENMPAQISGIEAGDKILSINNNRINSWEDVTKEVGKSDNKNINLKILRNNKEKDITIKPVKNEKENRFVIGIEPKVEKSITKSIKNGFENLTLVIKMMLEFITRLFQGNVNKNEVAGPVGIIYTVNEASKHGFMYVLFFTGLLSVNLGVFNLLPIPALDGSRVMFLIAELLRGKPIDPNKEGAIHMIGFAILLIFMIVVTYNDIIKFNILNKIIGIFG